MNSNENSSVLFTPIRIGGIEVPNRFARSATHEYMAEDDGTVTDRLVALFRELAEGEVGLIITGHAFVLPGGKASPRQTGVYDDRLIEGLKRIPPAVHDFPSLVFLQIAHAGRQTKERLLEGTPIAPSAVYEPTFKLTPQEATPDDIGQIIEAFVQAARRAQEAGFDGVQVHVAHGYLLSSFLSPHTNRRTDEWGGSVENRVRAVLAVITGIKALCGRTFPVIAKLNSTDFLPTGLHLEDAISSAQMMQSAGLDGLEISGGMTEAGKGSVWQGLRTEDEEGYFVDAAAAFKAALKIPVFGLGGNRTFARMERIVAQGRADLISLSRPLIREPHLIRDFRLGRTAKSACISCNKCFNPRGISCGDLKAAARKV